MQRIWWLALTIAVAGRTVPCQQASPAQPASQTAPSPPLTPAPSISAPEKSSPVRPPASHEKPFVPDPDRKKGWVCDAPPTDVFTDAFDTHPEYKGEVFNYVRLVRTQLYKSWIGQLPRSAWNAWAKGRLVKVRFAVRPDGSFLPPELTVPSGSRDYDYAAIDAILQHRSFPPPPHGPWKALPICMTFATNMDPSQEWQDWMKDAR
jgi:TonB family protein